MELEEGPLPEDSSTEQVAVGLPLDYLLGNQSDLQSRFYTLQVEETLSSLESTEVDVPSRSKQDMRLDLQQHKDESSIIFSPGGSEGYVFTRAPQEYREADSQTPRELTDVFVQVSSSSSSARPFGERPTTVGQSDDSVQSRMMGAVARPLASSGGQPGSRRSDLKKNALQGRLEDVRFSLEFATTADEMSQPSTTEPSPRRNLPRIPSDAQATTDGDSVSSLPSPSTGRRATSPSVASVTSGTSSVEGQMRRRRNLEWDSGADLGYMGDLLHQKEAAASLSTLEKMAIGNYSAFLRTEPEGKSAVFAAAAAAAAQLQAYRLPGGTDPEEDLRQMRLHKFADSLIKQRQMRQMVGNVQHDNVDNKTRSQSKSDNTSPDSSPMKRRVFRKRQKSSSPVKSSSLTDLNEAAAMGSHRRDMYHQQRHSVSDLSKWFSKRSHHHSTEPSSSSSTTTVVPQLLKQHNIHMDILHAISTDPSSLPAELQNLLAMQSQVVEPPAKEPTPERDQASLNSNSRQSVGHSFETVINVDAQQQYQPRQRRRQVHQKKMTSTTEDSDSMDTEEEIRMVRLQLHQQRSAAYGQHSKETMSTQTNNWVMEERAQSLPPPPTQPQSSRKAAHSSAATTSEDEKLHAARRRRNDVLVQQHKVDVGQQVTTTSTLESGAPIDRAKSFEYFPGESFPLQENSSSYEYLPGHMVQDRPGTVVSNRPPASAEEEDSTSTSSGAPPARKQFGQLDRLASELMDKTSQLHFAQVSQTKAFYERLKRYIGFISQPSQTPSDCQLKQLMADKIMDLMTAEEFKLANVRPLSAQLEQMVDKPSAPPSRPEDDMTDRGSTSEPTTRPVGAQPPADVAATTSDLFTLKSWTNVDESADDITIQKLRIGQMKKLRKEIRKLEKLECIRLNKALGGPADMDKELLKQVFGGDSKHDEQSSFDSLSTDVTNVSQEHRTSGCRRIIAADTLERRGIEGKSASGSDSNVVKTTSKKMSPKKAKKKTSSNNNDDNGTYRVNKSRPSTSKSRQDFGQMYPTPRQEQKQQQMAEKDRSNKQQTVKAVPKKKPLAYYLPMDNQSSVRIGKRILKEKLTEDTLGKENRNLLANYISAIDANAVNLEPNKRPTTTQQKEISSRRRPDISMTLQDALAKRKPDFLERSAYRVHLLKLARAQRLEFAERQRQWLEIVAQTQPGLLPPPPPEMPKIKRVFSYREMTSQSRQKYEKLPEILQGEANARLKSIYRTNRLKADMYKKRLQTNVLRGKVSLTHHNNIL